VLRGGLHVLFPFMYRIHKSDLVPFGQGKIAYVSRATAQPSSIAGAWRTTRGQVGLPECAPLSCSAAPEGPQRKILREGTYAINTTSSHHHRRARLWSRAERPRTRRGSRACSSRSPNAWGFAPGGCWRPITIWSASVTVHDARRCLQAKSIAPEVGTELRDAATFHNNFRSRNSSMAAAYRGRQLQVIVGAPGNQPPVRHRRGGAETVIPVGNVGVVIFLYRPEDRRRLGRAVPSR